MSRFIQDVVLNKPADFVAFIMNDYLQKNGFTMADWKGEPAFRAGDPMLEGYKFLKWSYTDGVFHLEAWMKGTFGGEWDLEGFVGCAQKGPYKNTLKQLIATLQQPLPQQNMNAMGPDGTTQHIPAPIPVQTVDNQNAATLALVFGVLTIVVGFLSPILCIIFAVLGFSQARMGQGSTKAGLAKAGKICCIVGLCITAVMFLLNYMMIILNIIFS